MSRRRDQKAEQPITMSPEAYVEVWGTAFLAKLLPWNEPLQQHAAAQAAICAQPPADAGDA